MIDRLNPLTLLLYFLSCMLIPAASGNPFLLMLSLVMSLAFLLTLFDIKTVFQKLPIFLLFFIIVTVINPLTYHDGNTVLFYLNKKRITLEALLYGANSACMVISVLVWCISFTKIYTSDKVLYVLGRFSSKVATVVSLVLRLVPHYRKYIVMYRAQQKLLGLYGGGSLIEKIKAEAKLFSGFLAWSLEHSMTTADSMEDRGYGKARRKSFKLYSFRSIDFLLMAINLILSGLIIASIALGYLHFDFYPGIVFPTRLSWLVLPVYFVNSMTIIIYSLYSERSKP